MGAISDTGSSEWTQAAPLNPAAKGDTSNCAEQRPAGDPQEAHRELCQQNTFLLPAPQAWPGHKITWRPKASSAEDENPEAAPEAGRKGANENMDLGPDRTWVQFPVLPSPAASLWAGCTAFLSLNFPHL